MPHSIRARHIIMDRQRPRLFAVYSDRTTRADVAPTVAQLRTLPGVRADAMRTRMDDATTPSVVVWLNVEKARDQAAALRLFQRLTNPELPIAIGRVRLELLLCKCNYISSRLTDLRFVTGFEPDDHESFMLRYYAAVKPVKFGLLLASHPNPPYLMVTEALERVLATLGAVATEINIYPGRDHRPCTHQL